MNRHSDMPMTMTQPTWDLSFVRHDVASGRATSFWYVEPTGDWGKDCAQGRNLATELLDYMRRTANTPILSHVMQSMGELTRPWSGLEVGFCQMIAEQAVR